MIRSGILKTKNVHVKLGKETHIAFKTRLMQHDVSMQEAFEAFARAVAADESQAINIIKRLVRNHIKAELASVGIRPTPPHKRKPQPLDELDVDTMYDLINEGEPGDDDDEAEPPLQDRGRHEAA